MKRHPYFWKSLVLSVAVGGMSLFALVLSPNQASASIFNPNVLVSNGIFTDKDAMSVADIQSFLVSKNSVLTQVAASDLGDPGDVGGRSVAQIIWDASREVLTNFASGAGFGPSNPLVVSINPEVILVTLQKEQSLITGSYVPGSPQTATALQHAMGYGCPDSGGCNPAYAGFVNQVVYAAAQFTLNYYLATNAPGQAGYKIGQTYTLTNAIYPPYCLNTSTNVTIGNASTSALYWYTPHVCNGNANFWLYMDSWFRLPNYQPGLARDAATGTIYAIDDGGRWPVTAEGFQHWNFNPATVVDLSTRPDWAALPVKSSFTQLAVDETGTVWYIDNGTKRVINSIRIFNLWHFDWNDVSPISNTIINELPYGLPAYELILPTGDGTIYLATNGQRYPISGDTFYNSYRFNDVEAGRVPSYVTASLPLGPLLGRFAMPMGGDGTIFLVDRGYGYRISAAVAQAWGFDFSATSVVGVSVLDGLQAGGLMTTLIKQEGGDGTVYLVGAGKKRAIAYSAWVRGGYRYSDVKVVTTSLFNTLPTGSVLR